MIWKVTTVVALALLVACFFLWSPQVRQSQPQARAYLGNVGPDVQAVAEAIVSNDADFRTRLLDDPRVRACSEGTRKKLQRDVTQVLSVQCLPNTKVTVINVHGCSGGTEATEIASAAADTFVETVWAQNEADIKQAIIVQRDVLKGNEMQLRTLELVVASLPIGSFTALGAHFTTAVQETANVRRRLREQQVTSMGLQEKKAMLSAAIRYLDPNGASTKPSGEDPSGFVVQLLDESPPEPFTDADLPKVSGMLRMKLMKTERDIEKAKVSIRSSELQLEELGNQTKVLTDCCSRLEDLATQRKRIEARIEQKEKALMDLQVRVLARDGAPTVLRRPQSMPAK